MGWELEPSQVKGPSQVRGAGSGPAVLGGGEEGAQGTLGKEEEKGQGGVHLSLSLCLSLPRPGRGLEPSEAR